MASATPPSSPMVMPKHLNDLVRWRWNRKKGCVNHVAKRMKTAFLKLAAEGKKCGVVRGGKDHEKLTGTTIKTLANYYDNAIQTNRGNLVGMREADFATFFHTISTYEDPPPHPLSRRGPPAGASTRGHWTRGRNRAAIVRMFTQPCHGKLPATSRMSTCA